MFESQIYPHTLPERNIRLLTIKPGDPHSPLVCTLQETCLDTTKVSYNALSYCWGVNDSPVQIECDSHPLLVTPNLHAALLEYRRRATSTPLWVDAICINQFNIPERTAQVRIMRSIYSQAACVVVWLGGSESTDEKALELLKLMNAPWATVKDDRGRDVPLFTGGNHADHDAYVAAQVPEKHYDALAAFLMRPWFGRIWIIQELLCAQNLAIWCGSETLNEEFPVLDASARLMLMPNCNVKTQLATTDMADKEAQGVGRLKLSCAGRLWALKTAKEAGMDTILQLLLFSHCFDSTDPRDKIFALIGLASDIDEDFVDYSKPYEDLIKDLSHRFLDGRIRTNTGSALDVLSCINRTEDEELAGPSWVVDWLKLQNTLYSPLMGQYPSESPVIKRSPEVKFVQEGSKEILEVRGVVFDRITEIVPSPIFMRQLVPQSDFLTFKYVPDFHKWLESAGNCIAPPTDKEEHAIYEPTGEYLYNAFWRTLCCNRSTLGLSTVPADDTSYVAWCRLLKLQQARCELEARYRRGVKLQRWGLWGFAGATVAALTYGYRHNKLLFIAIPFSLPPLIRFLNLASKIGLDTLLGQLNVDYMQQSAQTQIDQREFENSHSQWTQGRQFGVTANGMMGWVPLIAKPGDSVGLFAGCRIPYVLRAVEGGYKIVGDTYLHGVMDGEGERSEGEMLRIV